MAISIEDLEFLTLCFISLCFCFCVFVITCFFVCFLVTIKSFASGDNEIVFFFATTEVKSIKQGGLRLFLMLFLMGLVNTPDRNSWRADQPSKEEYIVEMRYHDATAILTIELLENEIRIDRTGSMPSTSYLMQESVIVQRLLDELQQCAFDESVPEKDRLLIPEPVDAIDKAREALAFG